MSNTTVRDAYAAQDQLKNTPLIKAWLSHVQSALTSMSGVQVEFVTSLQDCDEETKIYHDHSNQNVLAFLAPVTSPVDKNFPDQDMDEECLPYYRVLFADGAELMADDSELFSLNPRFNRLIGVVSGAFKCARDLDFTGPWHLAAEGSDEEKTAFLAAFEAQIDENHSGHWKDNIHTPVNYL